MISASHRLPERKHDELLAEVCRELESVWPASARAAVTAAPSLLHGRVIAQPAAVFSVLPGVDRFRPPQQTPIENLALAGDWTATGWPATMEGAVRSGFQAVEAIGRVRETHHEMADELRQIGAFHAPVRHEDRLPCGGAGGMYCGSCLHGNTLAAALRAAGQDCLLVPMYTPIRTDEESVSIDRVAFGGINVYLQQHSAIFRHTPWALDRLLDRPRLLRWATSRSASVRPERLGAMTVSMLEGEQGRQRKEVEKLVQWLGRDIRPDVVHLNNAMLIGAARQITRRLGVPVVCSLSGEDSFLEKASRAASQPGVGRAAGARRRSGRPGGHESLLCRLHGRVSCRAARADSRGSGRD